MILGVTHATIADKKKKYKFLIFFLLILLILVSKYHLRFNIDRKFMELENLDKTNFQRGEMISKNLYAAGGVKYSGSLREIKIYRNNKLHKTIDLYDYITKGELRQDIRLTNNDIVFVGARKNSIQLSGELYNPAIYETLPGEDLNSLIKIAGGLPPTTQTNKINISRITPSEDRTSEVVSDRTLLTVALR